VVTSAVTGAGLHALLARVHAVVAATYGVPTDDGAPRLTRERHRVAVTQAREELRAFRDAWCEGAGVPAVVAAVHLRSATEALGDVIGRVDVEDVLDRLFADFCVGK
jgi:tRNA modification GTPase